MFRAGHAIHPGHVVPAPVQALIAQTSRIHQLLAEPAARELLVVLLGIDLALIAIHVLISAGQYLAIIGEWTAGPLGFLSVTSDSSLPEIFNHLKEAAMLVVLVLAWVRSRQAVYLAWSAIMLLILGDDSLRIHENIGQWISTILPAAWSGEATHVFHENVVWVAYALLASSLLWCGHQFSGAVERANSWAILTGVLLVSFFAVGVDAIHAIVVRMGAGIDTRLINGLLGVVEDGGEMLMLSLTCAIVLSVYRQNRSPVPRTRAASG